MVKLRCITFHYEALEAVGKRLKRLGRRVVFARGLSDTCLVEVWYTAGSYSFAIEKERGKNVIGRLMRAVVGFVVLFLVLAGLLLTVLWWGVPPGGEVLLASINGFALLWAGLKVPSRRYRVTVSLLAAVCFAFAAVWLFS